MVKCDYETFMVWIMFMLINKVDFVIMYLLLGCYVWRGISEILQ